MLLLFIFADLIGKFSTDVVNLAKNVARIIHIWKPFFFNILAYKAPLSYFNYLPCTEIIIIIIVLKHGRENEF